MAARFHVHATAVPDDCSATAAASHRWYLSAVTVFQNEAAHLDEWLAFNLLEGVEHFLLYDNFSTDNVREVLEPWIAAGIVELIDWPVHWKKGAQTKAFLDALDRLRHRSRWAAFIDIDEFLFSPTGSTVAEILDLYTANAGIVVNWQCYGSSGHKARPPGLTIESYIRRARTDWARNGRVKTIVDPSLAIEPQSAHLFKVQPGHSLVTEDFKPVLVIRKSNVRASFATSPPCCPTCRSIPIRGPSRLPAGPVSRLRINHYVTRSEEEMPLKYKDRDSLRGSDRRSHARYHDRNEVEDPILVPRAARVREVIAMVRGLAPTAPG